jgi:hypothetical protein
VNRAAATFYPPCYIAGMHIVGPTKPREPRQPGCSSKLVLFALAAVAIYWGARSLF